MRAGNEAHLFGGVKIDEAGEFGDVVLVGALGLLVVDVCEPFKLGRYVGEALELVSRE